MRKRRSVLWLATLVGLALLPLVSLRSAVPIVTADAFRNAGLRGFNFDSNTNLSDQDLRDLRSHGANLARFLVIATRAPGTDAYTLSPASLKAADRYARIGAERGFRLVLTLEPLPHQWKQEYWTNQKLQESIIEKWRELAARYKGNGTIAGYDLINEPIATMDGSSREAYSASGAGLWRRFATELIDAIRAIDPDHAIIFEPSPGARPIAFGLMDGLLDRNNIVYSTHMYEPHPLTHQGVYYDRSISYPGPPIGVGSWGRAQVASSLDPVRLFAARTNAPIFVGEFSIVRWAPGDSAINYLTDVLGIIDGEERWSWTYHSWRECECWDAEIPSSFYHRYPYVNARPQVPSRVSPKARRGRTDALLLLEKYFQQKAIPPRPPTD